MTPWQFTIALEQRAKFLADRHDFFMSLAWQNANFNYYAFNNPKKMPRLEKFLSKKLENKKQSKVIDEVAILARFKAYQTERGKKQHGRKKESIS